MVQAVKHHGTTNLEASRGPLMDNETCADLRNCSARDAFDVFVDAMQDLASSNRNGVEVASVGESGFVRLLR